MRKDTHPPSASHGRVLIVTELLDSWLAFYARALTDAGYDVTLVSKLDPSVQEHDHLDVLKYLLPAPFCRVIDLKEKSEISKVDYDFAIVGLKGSSPLNEKRQLRDVLGAIPVQAVMLRRYGKRLTDVGRLIAKDVLYPFIRRSPRLLVEAYREHSWMLRLLAPISPMGIVPHHQMTCLGVPEGLGKQTERKYLFNFLGTYNTTPPNERTGIIDRLETSHKISSGTQRLAIGSGTFEIVWHADRPGTTRERPLNEYLDTVNDSYFTLCLPGYTVTTHRVWEAIICGSIPVLNADLVPHYCLPLVHGQNCWLVQNGDWESALVALSVLNQEKIYEMQSAVKSLALNDASMASLEKKSLVLLGLN